MERYKEGEERIFIKLSLVMGFTLTLLGDILYTQSGINNLNTNRR